MTKKKCSFFKNLPSSLMIWIEHYQVKISDQNSATVSNYGIIETWFSMKRGIHC